METTEQKLGQPTEEILERIGDALWTGEHSNHKHGVFLSDVYHINAANVVASGSIVANDGRVYGFVVESGDRNGTVVKEWGDPDEIGRFKPVDPGEPLTFIPAAPITPLKARIYRLWRKEPWFLEKERSYLYDRHFQPGAKIEGHYAAWAAEKGLTIGLLSDFERAAKEGVNP